MEERKLYRSRNDRMIGGVAAGIADYFDLDPSLVRLLAVLLGVVGNGVVVIAYIVMWVVVPEEPLAEGVVSQPAREPVAVGVASTASVGAATTYAVSAPSPQASPQTGSSMPPAGRPPAPPTVPQGPPPGPPSHGQGPRTGVIWIGMVLILLGVALLAREFVPNLDIWGFWPGTLVGLVLIAAGIRQMLTPGGDDR